MARLNEWVLLRRDTLAFALAMIVSVALLLSNDNSQVRALRVWTLDGFGFLLDRLGTFKRLEHLEAENRALRRRNAELMLETARLYEAGLENERLRRMLAFKAESELSLVPAKVVGHQNNGLINAMLIGAGERDGVHKDQAVVTAEGLVGRVFAVGKHYATTQLLLDRNFRASAMVQRSRVNGIVRWQGGDHVVLGEVPRRSDVQVGDRVVTSGLSTIFPAGLEIGTVIRSADQENGMFMDIEVRPSVDFSKLEEVFVIQTRPTSLP